MFSDDLWPRIGEPGRLLPIQFAAPEKLEQEDRYSFVTTLEGARRAQVRPLQPRSWTIDVPYGRGVDTAHIDAFASGAWGPGPWTFVPVAAQQGNLLTPRQSVLLDRWPASVLSDAGAMRRANGEWAPRSVTATGFSGWAATSAGIPVVAGKPFSWSLDVEGDGSTAPQVQVEFQDASGSRIESHIVAGSSRSGPQRVSVTRTAPAGAATASAGMRGTTLRACAPTASWLPVPGDWEIGQGCSSAVVLKSDSTLRSLEGGYTPLYTSDYEIMEVL